MNNFEEFENHPLIQAICNEIEKPKPGTKVITPQRFKDVIKAKRLLNELLAESFEEGEVGVEIMPVFSAASLSVEVDSFEARNAEKFYELISLADNFELIPLLNGRLQFSLTFNRVMSRV